MASSWLPPLISLPGLKGETAAKGDGVIADPATELDPSIKAGPLVTPLPGPEIVSQLITDKAPDWLRDLVTDAVTVAGYTPNQGAVGNMKQYFDSTGFGSDLGAATQKTNYRVDGQSVFKVTTNVSDAIKKRDYVYLDGQHMDHLEVFESRGNFNAVVNLDGTRNQAKTDAGSGRTINVK
ncbi:hypothetical protein [Paraburkholderia sp. GAS333]|uniref:hypothetical protein n=1 Tax=Paraburkholderia sp. GAS333 TaxID=3156279 RepID=UPI003D22F975